MLQLRLRDRRTGARLIAATTHLKAKAGAKNKAIRQRQVHWLFLRHKSCAAPHVCSCSTSDACSPSSVLYDGTAPQQTLLTPWVSGQPLNIARAGAAAGGPPSRQRRAAVAAVERRAASPGRGSSQRGLRCSRGACGAALRRLQCRAAVSRAAGAVQGVM